MEKQINSRKLCLKPLALMVTFVFTVTTVAWSAPALPGSITTAGNQTDGVIFDSFLSDLEIPAELGSIQDRYIPNSQGTRYLRTPPKVPGTLGGVVHIQDAHGSFEAQENIQAMLEHLHSEYGIDTVFIEGASEEVTPERLKFFRDDALSYKLAQTLTQDGIMGGAELFLLQNTDAKIYGVEDKELYQQNLEAFRAVYAQKEIADEYLESLKSQIVTESSNVFNKKLNKFFREWMFYQDVPEQLMRQLKILKQYANQELQYDFDHAYIQLDWPQLFRVFRLEGLEKERDPKAAGEEIRKLEEWLKEKARDEVIPEQITRHRIEAFYDQVREEGFSFQDYPNLAREWGLEILKSEIETRELFQEIEKLTDEILNKLADTEEARALIQTYKNYLLLEKLFHLELTYEEYEEIASNGDSVIARRPNLACRQAGADEAISDLPAGQAGIASPANDALRARNDVGALFHQALAFYAGARAREGAMIEKMTEKMKEKGITEAVLVTGGFHANGLQSQFRTHQLSYAEVTPHISKVEGNDTYLDAMLLDGDYLTLRSYIAPEGPREVIQNADLFYKLTGAAAGLYRSELRSLQGFGGEYGNALHQIRVHDNVISFQGNPEIIIDEVHGTLQPVSRSGRNPMIPALRGKPDVSRSESRADQSRSAETSLRLPERAEARVSKKVLTVAALAGIITGAGSLGYLAGTQRDFDQERQALLEEFVEAQKKIEQEREVLPPEEVPSEEEPEQESGDFYPQALEFENRLADLEARVSSQTAEEVSPEEPVEEEKAVPEPKEVALEMNPADVGKIWGDKEPQSLREIETDPVKQQVKTIMEHTPEQSRFSIQMDPRRKQLREAVLKTEFVIEHVDTTTWTTEEQQHFARLRPGLEQILSRRLGQPLDDPEFLKSSDWYRYFLKNAFVPLQISGSSKEVLAISVLDKVILEQLYLMEYWGVTDDDRFLPYRKQLVWSLMSHPMKEEVWKRQNRAWEIHRDQQGYPPVSLPLLLGRALERSPEAMIEEYMIAKGYFSDEPYETFLDAKNRLGLYLSPINRASYHEQALFGGVWRQGIFREHLTEKTEGYYWYQVFAPELNPYPAPPSHTLPFPDIKDFEWVPVVRPSMGYFLRNLVGGTGEQVEGIQEVLFRQVTEVIPSTQFALRTQYDTRPASPLDPESFYARAATEPIKNWDRIHGREERFLSYIDVPRWSDEMLLVDLTRPSRDFAGIRMDNEHHRRLADAFLFKTLTTPELWENPNADNLSEMIGSGEKMKQLVPYYAALSDSNAFQDLHRPQLGSFLVDDFLKGLLNGSLGQKVVLSSEGEIVRGHAYIEQLADELEQRLHEFPVYQRKFLERALRRPSSMVRLSKYSHPPRIPLTPVQTIDLSSEAHIRYYRDVLTAAHVTMRNFYVNALLNEITESLALDITDAAKMVERFETKAALRPMVENLFGRLNLLDPFSEDSGRLTAVLNDIEIRQIDRVLFFEILNLVGKPEIQEETRQLHNAILGISKDPEQALKRIDLNDPFQFGLVFWWASQWALGDEKTGKIETWLEFFGDEEKRLQTIEFASDIHSIRILGEPGFGPEDLLKMEESDDYISFIIPEAAAYFKSGEEWEWWVPVRKQTIKEMRRSRQDAERLRSENPNAASPRSETRADQARSAEASPRLPKRSEAREVIRSVSGGSVSFVDPTNKLRRSERISEPRLSGHPPLVSLLSLEGKTTSPSQIVSQERELNQLESAREIPRRIPLRSELRIESLKNPLESALQSHDEISQTQVIPPTGDAGILRELSNNINNNMQLNKQLISRSETRADRPRSAETSPQLPKRAEARGVKPRPLRIEQLEGRELLTATSNEFYETHIVEEPLDGGIIRRLQLENLETGTITNLASEFMGLGTFSETVDVTPVGFPGGDTVIFSRGGPVQPDGTRAHTTLLRRIETGVQTSIPGDLKSISFADGNSVLDTETLFPSSTVIGTTHTVAMSNLSVTDQESRVITAGPALVVDTDSNLVIQPEIVGTGNYTIFVYQGAPASIQPVQTIQMGSGLFQSNVYTLVDGFTTPAGRTLVSIGLRSSNLIQTRITDVNTGQFRILEGSAKAVDYEGNAAVYTIVDPGGNTRLVRFNFQTLTIQSVEIVTLEEQVVGFPRVPGTTVVDTLDLWRGQDVTAFYDVLLGREPEPAGLAFWKLNLQRGMLPSEVVAAFTASQENFSNLSVRNIYWDALGRAPEPAGEAFYNQQLSQGVSIRTIETWIHSSPEAIARSFYLKLLGREPETAGLNFWMSIIRQGASPEQIAQGFRNSREFFLRMTNIVAEELKNFTGVEPADAEIQPWRDRLIRGEILAIDLQALMMREPALLDALANRIASAQQQPSSPAAALKAFVPMSPEEPAPHLIIEDRLVGIERPLAATVEETLRLWREQDITVFYQEILGRDPGQAELDYYVDLLERGALMSQIEKNFSVSPENVGNLTVERLYRDILGREASDEEVAYYEEQLEKPGITILQVQDWISTSPEAKVRGYYLEFLGREPELAGLNFHMERLRNEVPESEVIRGFLNSPEFFGRATEKISVEVKNLTGQTATETQIRPWRDALVRGEIQLIDLAELMRRHFQLLDALENQMDDRILAALSPELQALRTDLIERGIQFFLPGSKTIDPGTRFAYDAINIDGTLEAASKFTQPTLIGFQLQMLGDAHRGKIGFGSLTSGQILNEMETITSNLLAVQSRWGWNGLLPAFFRLDQPGPDPIVPVDSIIGVGDNLNLIQSLAVMTGSLENSGLTGAPLAQANRIIANAEQFIANQEPGYLASVSEFGVLYNAYDTANGEFISFLDRTMTEFRSGLLFAAVRYPSLPRSIWNDVLTPEVVYTDQNGTVIENVSTFDGTAFQMFLSLLRFNELAFPGFRAAHVNQFVTHADFANQYHIPGWLSAAEIPEGAYIGDLGIRVLQEGAFGELIMDVGSSYAIASAFPVNPLMTMTWLNAIAQVPNLLGTYGLVDSARSGTEYANRFLAVDIGSTVLGLSAQGPRHFDRYLETRRLKSDYYTRFAEKDAQITVTETSLPVSQPPVFPERSLAVFPNTVLTGPVADFPIDDTYQAGVHYQYGVLPAGFGGQVFEIRDVYDARGNQFTLQYSAVDPPGQLKFDFKDEADQLLYSTVVDVAATTPGLSVAKAQIELPAIEALSGLKKVILVVDQNATGDTSADFFLHSMNFQDIPDTALLSPVSDSLAANILSPAYDVFADTNAVGFEPSSLLPNGDVIPGPGGLFTYITTTRGLDFAGFEFQTPLPVQSQNRFKVQHGLDLSAAGNVLIEIHDARGTADSSDDRVFKASLSNLKAAGEVTTYSVSGTVLNTAGIFEISKIIVLVEDASGQTIDSPFLLQLREPAQAFEALPLAHGNPRTAVSSRWDPVTIGQVSSVVGYSDSGFEVGGQIDAFNPFYGLGMLSMATDFDPSENNSFVLSVRAKEAGPASGPQILRLEIGAGKHPVHLFNVGTTWTDYAIPTSFFEARGLSGVDHIFAIAVDSLGAPRDGRPSELGIRFDSLDESAQRSTVSNLDYVYFTEVQQATVGHFVRNYDVFRVESDRSLTPVVSVLDLSSIQDQGVVQSINPPDAAADESYVIIGYIEQPSQAGVSPRQYLHVYEGQTGAFVEEIAVAQDPALDRAVDVRFQTGTNDSIQVTFESGSMEFYPITAGSASIALSQTSKGVSDMPAAVQKIFDFNRTRELAAQLGLDSERSLAAVIEAFNLARQAVDPQLGMRQTETFLNATVGPVLSDKVMEAIEMEGAAPVIEQFQAGQVADAVFDDSETSVAVELTVPLSEMPESEEDLMAVVDLLMRDPKSQFNVLIEGASRSEVRLMQDKLTVIARKLNPRTSFEKRTTFTAVSEGGMIQALQRLAGRKGLDRRGIVTSQKEYLEVGYRGGMALVISPEELGISAMIEAGAAFLKEGVLNQLQLHDLGIWMNEKGISIANLVQNVTARTQALLRIARSA